jgi:hypothetical protein
MVLAFLLQRRHGELRERPDTPNTPRSWTNELEPIQPLVHSLNQTSDRSHKSFLEP